MTQAERITALEIEVAACRNEIKELREDVKALLELKYKGAGAFWLASILFGTGIAYLFSWLKGH